LAPDFTGGKAMRYRIASAACAHALAALMGAVIMSDVVADEKKEEPKEFRRGDITYDERVVVKEWDAQGKKYLRPVEGVWATRVDTKKGLMFRVLGTTKPDADLTKRPGVFRVRAPKDSVIIDAAGNEYTVTEAEGDNDSCFVKLTKAAPAKP
jgi:hypothetical protein